MFVAGYELFGEERASCTDGESWPEMEDLPQCAINMARYHHDHEPDDDDEKHGWKCNMARYDQSVPLEHSTLLDLSKVPPTVFS